MTGQERDKEWVKSEFEQLQRVTRMNPRWELANPNPLTFEIPRKVDSENSAGGVSRRTVKDLETGILLYNKELKGYSGFFPGDGEKQTRIIECINGVAFDTREQDEPVLPSHGKQDDVGICTVVEN